MVSRIEISYKIDDLARMILLARSPNLDISAGLVISISLGPQVFSVANYQLAGIVKIEEGAIIINGNKVKELDTKVIALPVTFHKHVTCAYLGE